MCILHESINIAALVQQPKKSLCSLLLVLPICLFCFSSTVAAQYVESGYTDLVNRVGLANLEKGAGVAVSQVEANEGDPNLGQFIYLANPAHPHFVGKTISDLSAMNTAFSNHAIDVGAWFYGTAFSIAPEVTQIGGYLADDWVFNTTGYATNTLPTAQAFRVQSHAYIGDVASVDQAEDILRRVDYMVSNNEMTVVVGENNGAAQPQLLGQGYNSIAVGRSNGGHSAGPTTLYGAGRIKPDIVAPVFSTTSISTAFISSAATLMHSKANTMITNNLASTDARRSEVIKAVLMAGATKDDAAFPRAWTQNAGPTSTTQPLDVLLGAGEVNVFNSYFIMEGGEFDGTAGAPSSVVSEMGWDYGESISEANSLFYDFDLGSRQAKDLSILLTWNIEVENPDNDNPLTRLADLQLRLYNSTGGFNTKTLLFESISAVDNVEHIWMPLLGSGRYTFEVFNNNGAGFNTDFGLAWRFQSVPEPTSLAFTLFALGGVMLRRRRKPVA